MKVYKNGVNLVVEKAGDPKKKVIPQKQTRFVFVGTSTQIQDIVSGAKYTDLTTAIEDETGTPIGTEQQVLDYLSPIVGGIDVSGQTFDNRIIVNQSNVSTTLGGTIDSTKEYFIDGIIDMGVVSVTVPAGGIKIRGYNFDLSGLISSEVGYTMFVSAVGGSGNILGLDYYISVTGAGSVVYDLTDATGFNAFEFQRINYIDCESLGEITNYRQGLETGTGRFGGKPELTLSGTWLGGFFIDTSIVRSLVNAAYSIFKAGPGLVMNSRFRSNQNIDLPALVSFFDFSPSNFVNPSTLQLSECILSRNGVFDPTDANLTPNISPADLVSLWRGNNGLMNTFVGGTTTVTVEVATVVTTPGVFYSLLGTFTTSDLQHFDSPSNGQLRNLGASPREFSFCADLTIDGGANDELTVRLKKWDDSGSVFLTVFDQRRQVNSLVGARDVAFFNIQSTVDLDQNDFVFLEVANISNSNNVTIENSSFASLSER